VCVLCVYIEKSDEKTVVKRGQCKRGKKKCLGFSVFFFVSLEKRRHGEQFFFVLKSGYFSSFFITFLYSLLSEPNDGQKRARDDEDCVASFLFFSTLCVWVVFWSRAVCVLLFFFFFQREECEKREISC